MSLTGFYLYNRTDEPCSNYYEPGLDDRQPVRRSERLHPEAPAADPRDQQHLGAERQLGAGAALRLDAVPRQSVAVDRLRSGDARLLAELHRPRSARPASRSSRASAFTAPTAGLGHQDPVESRIYKSWGTNGTLFEVRRHAHVQAGRRLPADRRAAGQHRRARAAASISAASSPSSTGINNSSATDGNAIATFLLGYPSGDFQASGRARWALTTPLNLYTNYYGGYVQDDWRVSPKFTVNYGLRIEHEDGMRETEQQLHGRLRSHRRRARSNVTIPDSVDPTGGHAGARRSSAA